MKKRRAGRVLSPTGGATDALDETGISGSFPIVGIGASAGGLEAFSALLKHLPIDTGMGFVLVQHLDPEHDSALPQLLDGRPRCRFRKSQTTCAWSRTTCTSFHPTPT